MASVNRAADGKTTRRITFMQKYKQITNRDTG